MLKNVIVLKHIITQLFAAQMYITTRMTAADMHTFSILLYLLYFTLQKSLDVLLNQVSLCGCFVFLYLVLFLDCLRSFTDLEELDETELYMCHKCKKKQKSTKKFWIQKLPKVCISMKSNSVTICQRK